MLSIMRADDAVHAVVSGFCQRTARASYTS
jgi:hypothetical protein